MIPIPVKRILNKLTWKCKMCGSREKGKHEDVCDACYSSIKKTAKKATKKAKPSAKQMKEALSGSIADSKKAIKKMKNPDYKALLKQEKKGKNRKGMKKWLKSQA